MVDVSCMLCSCEFFVVMMRSLCSFALQRGVCNHVRACARKHRIPFISHDSGIPAGV